MPVYVGVHERHADLRYKVKDFVVVQPPVQLQPAHAHDQFGHGTHMARIMVGGNCSGTQIEGAPTLNS